MSRSRRKKIYKQPRRLQEANSESRRVQENIDLTYWSGPPTQEDQYWQYTGSGSGGVEEDFLWRRLSQTWYAKDVIPSIYLEVHNLCFEAYNANPLAFAIIEQTTSFVLGEGITVSANNKKVQSIIDAFWDNPDNHMEDRIYSLCTELALYGEVFVHFFVNQYDGSVVIRQIDPSLIDQIETDIEDIEHELRFHRRPIGQIMSETSGDLPPFGIEQMEVDNQGTWFVAGTEVLHVAINKVSNAKRGKSDLATLLPWLRRYKDWLTDRVRINKYKGAFLWDVTLNGADAKVISRKKMEYTYPPEPGSVLIHNEAEKWTAVQPNINAMDAKEDGRAVKMMVAVGATLPEHFLSDGDQGNRATAAEMSLPTLLKFKRRQRIVKYMLQRIIDRVILEAQKAGKLGKGARVDTSYEVTFPEIDSGEHMTLAQSANFMVQALANAKAQGWISDTTAMQMLFEFAGEEIDITEEMEKITAQQAAKLAAHIAMQQQLQTIQTQGQQGQPGQTQGQPGQTQGQPGQTQGQPGQTQGQPGQKTIVSNQKSLNQQQAEAKPPQVDGDTNAYGNPQNAQVNYGMQFGNEMSSFDRNKGKGGSK
jgi:hypothetical protein